MTAVTMFLFSAAAAALLCGASAEVAAAACAGSLIYLWLDALGLNGAAEIHAVNDPRKHSPRILATAAESALRRVIESRRRHILHISNPGINRLELRVDAGGELIASDSRRSIRIAGGEKWIADHPLPLAVEPGNSRRLLLVPADGGRVRVRPDGCPRGGRAALPLIPAALALLFTGHSALAAFLLAPVITGNIACHFRK